MTICNQNTISNRFRFALVDSRNSLRLLPIWCDIGRDYLISDKQLLYLKQMYG